jgi:hypothetical protein
MIDAIAHQLRAGFIGLGSVVLAVIALYLARLFVVWLWRALARCLLPLERRLLQFLQDRATSRTLGVDIDVIRIRRKIEFTAGDRQR